MLILQGFRNKFDSYVRKKKFFITTQFDKIKKNSNNNNNNNKSITKLSFIWVIPLLSWFIFIFNVRGIL